MTEQFTHAATTVDGVAIHHVVCGDGPPVILVPGWPQTWYAWRRVMPLLADAGYRAVALDPPGMGESGFLTGDYDTARVALLLRAAVRALGFDRFHLVGHDIGSWISFAWAARHGADLRTVTLTDAFLPGVTPDAALSIENAPRVFQLFFNAVPEIPELLTTGHERELLAWLFRTKSVDPDTIGPADLDEYMRSYGDPARMTAGFAYYRAVPANIAQNRAASALSMPVLALGAEKGTGKAMLRALEPHAPHLSGGQIDGAGHYLPEESPEALTRRILDFIRQHDA